MTDVAPGAVVTADTADPAAAGVGSVRHGAGNQKPTGRTWALRHYLMVLVAILVLSGSSGAWYVWEQAQHDALDMAGQAATFTASLAAAQLGADVAAVRTTVGQTAGNPGLTQVYARPRECSLVFSAPGGADSGRLDIVRSDGTLVCSSRPIDPAAGDYSAAPWLARALRSPVLESPALDPRTGRDSIIVAAPAPGLGMVVAVVDLAGIGTALAHVFGGPRRMEFLVTTGDGATVLTRFPEPERWIGEPVARTAFALPSGTRHGTDVTGARRVYGQATVDGQGWRVHAGAAREPALATARRLALGQGLIVTVGCLVGLLATLLVYRRITRPIGRLSEAVRASAATGAGGPPIHVTGPREVASLGDDFHDLVAAVQRELLERSRAERTAHEAERNYRQLFDLSPYPMTVFDPTTLALIEVNDAAAAYYGYPRERFRSMGLPDLCLPEDVPALVDAVARARNIERWGPLRQVRNDGTVTEASVTSHVLSFAGRQARCAILEDVTEKADLERRLRQSQRLESLGQLAGGVAHDFNNLLGIILGYATMAAGDISDEARADDRWRALHDDLAQIIQAGDRATGLTRQLLSFARAEVTDPRVLDVNEVINEIEQMLRRSIGEDIQVELHLADHAWRVKADPGQLEQVLVNLAVNARDAMPAGGTLTIDTENQAVDAHYAAHHPGTRPGNYLRLRVSDTGQGMSQDTVDRAFEPFFTTKPKGQGTGLGLATIYGIITQAGGCAQLYSEVGIGTTFSALLPATDEMATPVDPAPVTDQPGHGETILLVEDEESLRVLTERMLSRQNYVVFAAGDATEALRLAEGMPAVDLLVTDVVMPHMNGHDLAISLKARRPDLPVIYLSGYAEAILASRSPLPPDAILLSKPVTRHQLLAVIRRALDARQPRHTRLPTA